MERGRPSRNPVSGNVAAVSFDHDSIKPTTNNSRVEARRPLDHERRWLVGDCKETRDDHIRQVELYTVKQNNNNNNKRDAWAGPFYREPPSSLLERTGPGVCWCIRSYPVGRRRLLVCNGLVLLFVLISQNVENIYTQITGSSICDNPHGAGNAHVHHMVSLTVKCSVMCTPNTHSQNSLMASWWLLFRPGVFLLFQVASAICRLNSFTIHNKFRWAYCVSRLERIISGSVRLKIVSLKPQHMWSHNNNLPGTEYFNCCLSFSSLKVTWRDFVCQCGPSRRGRCGLLLFNSADVVHAPTRREKHNTQQPKEIEKKD